MSNKQTFIQKVKRVFLSGSMIAATVTLSSPIDFIRFRLQVMKELLQQGHLKQPYTGVINCAKRVWNEEGPRAFWKGNFSNIIRIVPNQSLIFILKQKLQQSLHYNQHFTEAQHLALNTIIGITSSLVVSCTLYPFEYARQKIANRTDNRKIGLWTILRQTVQKYGFKELYHGANVFVYGLLAFRGTYFGLYDSLKVKTQDEFVRWCYSYIATYLAIIVAYPSDTLRRRKVTSRDKYKNFSQCARCILQNEGIKGFYKGWNLIWLPTLTWCTFYFLYDRIFTDYSKAIQ